MTIKMENILTISSYVISIKLLGTLKISSEVAVVLLIPLSKYSTDDNYKIIIILIIIIVVVIIIVTSINIIDLIIDNILSL